MRAFKTSPLRQIIVTVISIKIATRGRSSPGSAAQRLARPAPTIQKYLTLKGALVCVCVLRPCATVAPASDASRGDGAALPRV